MFCDINHDCFGDQNLRTFLLDRNNNSSFNKQKYRVFCYIAKGPLFRMNGISVNCLNVFGDAPMFVTMSEISSVPLGFALYIDLPDGFKPEGCEITDFSDFRYDESVACEFTIPALESNVVFSGDYRTQQEIMKTIEENEERKKEHKGDNP